MNPFLLINSDDQKILRMDLAPDVGDAVRRMFSQAVQDLEHGIDELIAFDPGYQLQECELFQISDFPIEDGLLSACKQPLSVERLDAKDLANLPVKSIVGYSLSGDECRLYFQNFDSRRILIPGKRFAVWALADRSTFQELTEPVVILDGPLAAIWENGVLKFKSFHLARQLFDLSTYFKAATNEQVEQFIEHRLLLYNDKAKLIGGLSDWYRKKIALILRGDVLDEMTIKSIRKAGKLIDYEVPVQDNRILLPDDKKMLKELLQFLDEDIYRGIMSQRKLLSSGKREC